jgi:hypothetical protein
MSDNAETGLTNWTTSSTGTGALQWKIDSTKPQHASNTFNVQGTPGITNADSYLTYNNPITIPAGGQTFLTFLDWDDNEGEDNVLVEVSENNGATWVPVYTHNRSESGTGAVSFATEPLFSRSVSLSNFGGKTIRLRFHYSLGPEDRPASVPFGWYVDDIAIMNDNWLDVTSVAGTSLLLAEDSGTYCFRVRTTYLLNAQNVPGPFSNAVTVTVAPGIVIAKGLLKITEIVKDSGVPRISFTTLAGRSHRLERTDSLTNPSWTPLPNATNVAGTGGAVQIHDTEPGAGNLPHRFYRAVLLP